MHINKPTYTYSFKISGCPTLYQIYKLYNYLYVLYLQFSTDLNWQQTLIIINDKECSRDFT